MEHIRELRECLYEYLEDNLPEEIYIEIEEIIDTIEDKINDYEEEIESLNKIISQQGSSQAEFDDFIEGVMEDFLNE